MKRKTKKVKRQTKASGCTFVSFVLDETGSMQPNAEATISGFNEYVKTLRKQKDECRFTLVLFNTSKTETRHKSVPLDKVELLTKATYKPNGLTPLYDAIGQCIRDMEEEVKAVSPKPAVIVTIMTDGEENSSKEFTREGIFQLISAKKKDGWNFMFLGSNQDAWQTGHKLGVPTLNTMTYYDNSTDQTLRATARAVNVYRNTSAGASASCENIIGSSNLSDWQKKLDEDEKKLKKQKPA